jgi:carboxymethylenebutenolidase
VSDNVKPNESTQETDLSCREFGAASFAAGLAAVAGAAAAKAAERSLLETDVTVKTPDGNCDAVHPMTGSYPGLLILTDIFGLRPSMRQFARRIAADGYSVLVPKPFYRTRKAAVLNNPSAFDFGNPADTAWAVRVKAAAAVPDRIAAGASARRDRCARWNRERETGKGGRHDDAAAAFPFVGDFGRRGGNPGMGSIRGADD